MSATARRTAWAARPRAAAALATLALLAGTAPASAVPAPATPPAAPADVADDVAEAVRDVRLVLDDVEPTVVRVGEPVTLEGRIVNDGASGRRFTGVRALAAWTTLGGRSEVAGWVDGTEPLETGWVLAEGAIGPVVAAGQEIPFRVEIPAWTFAGLPEDLAALAVELRAVAEEGAEPVGLRTVLSVARTDEVPAPLEHAWVVPLTLPPDPTLASTDATARHEAWHAAVGPGSPARTWLDALDQPEVTWLVDPSLLVQLSPTVSLTTVPVGEGGPDEDPSTGDGQSPTTPGADPRDDEPAGGPGGTGTGPDGATVTATPPGTARDPADQGLDVGGGLGSPPEDDVEAPPVITQQVVEDELGALRERLTRVPDGQLWWLPVADPDVAALLELEVSPPTARAAMSLPLAAGPEQVDALLERGRGDVALPALAAPGADDVQGLDRLWSGGEDGAGGLSVLVLPAESLSGGTDQPVGRAAARVAAVPSVTAVGGDSRAAGLLSAAGSTAATQGVGAAVQQLLADSLTAYQQKPGESRSLVYAPARGAAVPEPVLTELSEGLENAPWTMLVGADRLVSAAAEQDPVALTAVPPDPDLLDDAAPVGPPAAALDTGRVRSLVQLQTRLGGLAQIFGESSAVEAWEPVLGQQWSTSWRHNPDLWSQSWRELRSLTAETAEGVHVNPSTVNFLSDSGTVRVTVVNDLPVAVEGVRVQVVPDKSLLRIVDQPEPVSIGAESRATVSFTAQAVTRGETAVTAQLAAPNGTRLGDDATVTVRVRPTGVWIYWVLGSAAGLVLVLGLVRALRSQPRAASVPSSGPREEGS